MINLNAQYHITPAPRTITWCKIHKTNRIRDYHCLNVDCNKCKEYRIHLEMKALYRKERNGLFKSGKLNKHQTGRIILDPELTTDEIIEKYNLSRPQAKSARQHGRIIIWEYHDKKGRVYDDTI